MRVQLRHYAIKLVRPSSSTGGGDAAAAATAAFGDPSAGAAAAAAGPAVALSELGPRLDFVSNRAQWASDDLRRTACKGPRHAGTPRKTKNVSYDADGLGDTVGRLHVERQNLGALALTRTKALGNRRRHANWREGVGGDDDDDEGGAPDVEGGGGGGGDDDNDGGRGDGDDDSAAAAGGGVWEEDAAAGGGMDIVDDEAAA